MEQPTNNSKNLNQTCPTPPITDRMSSSQIITIDPSGVGRVRLRSIEFSDIYLHKPAPTDPRFGIRSIDLQIQNNQIKFVIYS